MFAALSVLLLLAGCGGGQDAVKEHKERQIVGEAKGEFPYSYPLTGEGTVIEPQARAVAVVINNHPQARPQSGLHKADIIYELLAEGEVTRFIKANRREWSARAEAPGTIILNWPKVTEPFLSRTVTVRKPSGCWIRVTLTT